MPSLLALILLILTACSQLDIEPNRTTHEDLVKDNMRDGQANHTTLFDEDRKTPTLRELVLGEDSSNYQASLDSLTFNVILDKLSFMPLASVDSSSGIIITDWHTINENELRIKINELNDNSISVQMFTQKFDGSNWIDQGQDNEKANKIKESILIEARSLKTAVDLS